MGSGSGWSLARHEVAVFLREPWPGRPWGYRGTFADMYGAMAELWSENSCFMPGEGCWWPIELLPCLHGRWVSGHEAAPVADPGSGEVVAYLVRRRR